MKKLFFVLAILFALAFSQFVSSGVTQVGGFKVVPEGAMQQLLDSDMFKKAEMEARKEFSQKNDIELGRIVGVKEQVVAGMNYKITFATPAGNYDVTVFVQPWTNTVKVTNIEKNVAQKND
jgi:hypothetical protein